MTEPEDEELEAQLPPDRLELQLHVEGAGVLVAQAPLPEGLADKLKAAGDRAPAMASTAGLRALLELEALLEEADEEDPRAGHRGGPLTLLGADGQPVPLPTTKGETGASPSGQ